MNREALLNLARVVEAAPEERWNMSYFGTCNTARCAAGHAAEDLWFRVNAPIPFDRYGCLDWDNIHKPFSITQKEAYDLFGEDTCIGTKVSKLAVLTNIRCLLRGAPTKEY